MPDLGELNRLVTRNRRYWISFTWNILMSCLSLICGFYVCLSTRYMMYLFHVAD